MNNYLITKFSNRLKRTNSNVIKLYIVCAVFLVLYLIAKLSTQFVSTDIKLPLLITNILGWFLVIMVLYVLALIWFSKFSNISINQALVSSIPFSWLFIFFLLPFVIIIKISFAEAEIAIPPYTKIYEWLDNILTIKLNLNNYTMLTEDRLYVLAYFSSIKIALICTLICLLLGYPMAHAIARANKETQILLLLLIMMPTWTAILIRVYAWMGILSNNGILNAMLLKIGIINEPLIILNTNLAVYIGIVYAYLPFMILPLYANLVKHDESLLEAASDLGSSQLNNFWKITVPLSKNGIIAGCMLVFIPVVGEFVIPELLGGSETLMIGKVLWQEFFNNRDWPMASALAVVMLAILIVPIILFNKNQTKALVNKV